mmetsp:Transcript_148711/g.262599  ORF Transcript_148711/g.262599 Transcript_148711/m.262599 type:complete len:829 (+) Transcript_148711:115-2601(+)
MVVGPEAMAVRDAPALGAEAAETAASPAPEERRKGRRVGALLNAYYRIEGAEKKEPVPNGGDANLDYQGFDAKRFFDNMVASGQLTDLVKRSSDLDSEIKDLDSSMQTLVYQNYSKFIRATDVIRMMKGSIDGLQPDLRILEGNVGRITEHQRRVEDGVAGRSRQIETLLTQQRVCKKLKVLFDLPQTLQRCLDRGAYGKAVEAYCCCSTFLRQYRDQPTFKKVLEEVEHQMSRIRTALEERLRSPELSVDEAVNSSVTLLDLGEDQSKVAREYLSGRAAVLQRSLDRCFAGDAELAVAAATDQAADASQEQPAPELSKDQQELQRPESVALGSSCKRAADLYVPHLCDAVEGFQKLQEGRIAAPGNTVQGSISEETLSDFVRARVEDLCDRISKLVELKCPPTRVLVSCIHSVRDALRRLHSMLPKLMTKLFMGFLERIANNAMQALFATGAAGMVADLGRLHGECKRLQASKNKGLDDVLEEIEKIERNMIMHGFTALTDCQLLNNLLCSDKPACQRLVRGLHGQLITFFLAFVEACYAYARREVKEAHSLDPSLPSLPRVASAELEEMANLDWSGLFALALVRIGRHLEVKAINKVWTVAKDLFNSGDGSELVPEISVIKATRGAAQATITHYVLTSGQRLAHFFRNSIQNRNWMTVREPRDPRLVVEMVLREVHAFDAQLARILGDPRKPRGADMQRRVLSRVKNDMELEMERLWAKKLQVFATIPFNRNGAIVGILRIAYKALCEYVREETFAKFGLQQIQVDCAFLAEITRDFVEAEDAGVLDSLLDEAVTSASQRCVEPVLMEAVIVETLCEEKKKTFKIE